MEYIHTLTQAKERFPETNIIHIDPTLFIDANNEDEPPLLLKERLLNGKIVDVDVLDNWTDDREFCCLLGFKFEGDDETYLLACWWWDPAGLLVIGKSMGRDSNKEIMELLGISAE